MSETADERLRLWQRMGGSGRWGIGVAVDIEAIEARLAALESSRSVHIAPETVAAAANDPEREGEPAASDGPGRGYRWVEVGEELERGDELWWVHAWQVTARSPGAICRDEKRYRRRITPAEAVPDDAGRRLVQPATETSAQ